MESKDIGIRKSEFVAKTQFLLVLLDKSLKSITYTRTINPRFDYINLFFITNLN